MQFTEKGSLISCPCRPGYETNSHCLHTLFLILNLIGAVGFSWSHFGGGSGGIFLDNLGCYGYESRLLDCTRPTIGIHDCDHSADAGVKCQGREAMHGTNTFPKINFLFHLLQLRVNIG